VRFPSTLCGSRMKWSSMLRRCPQASRAVLVNAGPLSTMISRGATDGSGLGDRGRGVTRGPESPWSTSISPGTLPAGVLDDVQGAEGAAAAKVSPVKFIAQRSLLRVAQLRRPCTRGRGVVRR